MSDIEAVPGLPPQRKNRTVKRYKLARRRTGGGIWAVMILFVLVILLCINNFTILRSYEEIRGNLQEAYKRIDSFGEMKSVLVTDNSGLEKEKLAIEKEKLALERENSDLKLQQERAEQQYDETQELLEDLKRKNSELEKENKQLADDNIALQNSLKMAAAVGVKPQNYSNFNGFSSRGDLDRGKYIGKFLGTAYTPSKEECGNNKGITNSGKPIIPGVSIAVDTRYWPFGTVFYIKGLGYAVAMDTGSAIKGKYRFDFSVFDKNFARQLGSRKWEVYLIKMGKGYVEDLDL